MNLRAILLLVALACGDTPAIDNNASCRRIVNAYRTLPNAITQTVPNMCGAVSIANSVAASLRALEVCQPFQPQESVDMIESRYGDGRLKLVQIQQAVEMMYRSCKDVEIKTDLFSSRYTDRPIQSSTKFQFNHVITEYDLINPLSGYDLSYSILSASFVSPQYSDIHAFVFFGFDSPVVGIFADPRAGADTFLAELITFEPMSSGHFTRKNAPQLVPQILPPVYSKVPADAEVHLVAGLRVNVRRK